MLKCNIWDNIFSHLERPLARIPDNFKIELYDYDTNIRNGDIIVSAQENQIKVSVLETIRVKMQFQKSLQSFLNIFLKNTQPSSEIENNNNNPSEKEILSFVCDFNTPFNIKLSNANTCVKRDVITSIGHTNVKLLLSSYDILTYVINDSSSEFYEYVFTNHIVDYNTNYNTSFAFLHKFLNDSPKSIKDEALLVFRINKASDTLVELIVSIEGLEIFHFKTKMIKYESSQVDKSLFDSTVICINENEIRTHEIVSTISTFVLDKIYGQP